MPRPPGIIDRVNYVIRSWDNPCDLPWALVVETALPAALSASIAVVCFGFTDVIRFIFRPAGLRTGRHMRRGRKGKLSRSPVALAARTIRKLPPLAALRQRKVSQGVKTLWIIDGIGQRLLWWWLVADVTSGFLYNWTLMIQKTEKCAALQGNGAGLATDATGFPLAIQTWPPVDFPTVEYERGSANVGGSAFLTGAGPWSIVGAVVYKNTFNATQRVEVRTRAVVDGRTIIAMSDPITVGPGREVEFLAILDIHGASFGAVEIQLDQGFGEVTDGSLFVFGHVAEPPPPVKFNCLSVEV